MSRYLIVLAILKGVVTNLLFETSNLIIKLQSDTHDNSSIRLKDRFRNYL